jgi:hypothetical protein
LFRKSADLVKRNLAERHISTYKVPDRIWIRGYSSMTASHNPEKLFWKPSGLAAEPVRFGEAADTVDLLVSIWRTKRVKPATQWNGVIVKKDYNRSTCLVQCCIPCTRESSVMAVGKYCMAIKVLATASQERIVVVNNHK